MTRLDVIVPIAQQVLQRHGQVAHLQHLLAAGLAREDVGHLRHRGTIRRARIGWYVGPGLPVEAVRAITVGGVLGCASAAASWGMVVPERSDVLLEVSVAPGSSRLRHSITGLAIAAGTEPGVHLHWEQRVTQPHGWRVSPVDALLQLAACADLRWLTAAVDSARCEAQHEALLTATDLQLLRERLPEHLRGAVDRSDARSATAGETFVRLELEDRGIPFVPQLPATSGYRPDGTVDGWLPVDIDGMASHAGREAGERDRERDATIAQFGVPPLRFSETKAVRETRWVCDVVEAVWRRGRPSTTTSRISRNGPTRR